MLFRKRLSHRVMQGDDWASVKVKGRFFFSAESRLTRASNILIAAFRQVLARRDDYRLIIAGRPENCEGYWRAIREEIREDVQKGRVLLRAEFIPDDETEIYFKAADVLSYLTGRSTRAASCSLDIVSACPFLPPTWVR